MRVILSLFLFTTTAAYAHIELGTYQGTTTDGVMCEMKVVNVSFINDTPHPLNERVEIQVASEVYTAGHPSVLNTADAVVNFNHDAFQAIVATKTGAKALVVEISHVKGMEGPQAFHLIENNWKTNEKEVTRCLGLKSTGQK